jgi:hypothetical protein
VEAQSDGTIVNQSGGIVVDHFNTGVYQVVFPLDISRCATVADLDEVPASPGGERPSTFGSATAGHFGAGVPVTIPGAGTVDSGRVATVGTTAPGSSASFTDSSFALVVFC